MTARDKFGHTYVYSDGTLAEKPIPGQQPILFYYFSENDGWEFTRRGPDLKIHMDLHQDVNSEGLEKILLIKSIDPDVKKILQEMVKSRDIKSGMNEYKSN